MQYQTTIHKNISFEGIGLHSGSAVGLTLLPALPNTGVVFSVQESSQPDRIPIAASWKNVQSSQLATTLKTSAQSVQTVEHLLAALNGLEIDNLLVELNAAEVPIMEGSAQTFTEAILRAGLQKQAAPRRYLQIAQKIKIEQEDRWIQIEPSPRMEIDCTIDFPNYPIIGKQSYQWKHSAYRFWQEISTARTFGFGDQFEALQKKGLIKGGSPKNAIIVDKTQIRNPENLRFKDEFVRHKILDILGDLYLAEGPILGKVTAYKSGHHLHLKLLEQIFSESGNYRWIEGTKLAEKYYVSRSANKFWYPN